MSMTAFSQSFQSVDSQRVDNLRRAIAEIESKLGAFSTPEPVPKDPALDRISQQMQQVMSEVAGLKAGSAHNQRPSLDDVVQQLQGGMRNERQRDTERQDALAHHLERLGKSFAGVENAALRSNKSQESLFSQGFNQVNHTVDDLPESRAVVRLEERLEHVNSKIEQLARAADASAVAQHNMLKNNNNFSDELAQVEARLAEIARAVIAISSGHEKANKSGFSDFSAVERIEARVADLARTVDRIADVQDEGLHFSTSDLRALEEQLATLTARLDREVSQEFENQKLSQIERHIAELAGRVDERPSLVLSSLEEQLRQLALSVEQIASTQVGSQQIKTLDGRLSQVIDALNGSQIGADLLRMAPDFSQMDGLLSKIEEQFAQSSSDIAAKSAQEAAERVLAAKRGDETLQALAEDLKKLRTIAEQDTAQTDRMTDALFAVAKRLEKMENGSASQAVDPVDEALIRAEGLRDAVIKEETLAETFAEEEHSAPVARNTFSESPSAEDLEDVFRDEILLEPGTLPEDFVAPPAELMNEPQQDEAFEIRPDAVSAARKALQATTAEVAAIGGDERSARKLRKEKSARPAYHRPVLVAAAVTLLSLSAYQGYQLVGAKGAYDAAFSQSPAKPIVVERSAGKGQDAPKVEAKPKSRIPVAQIVKSPKSTALQLSTNAPIAAVQPKEDTIVTGAISRETYDIPASVGTATFVAAVSAGEPRALYELGMRYSNGEGVEKDLKEAAHWLKKAADLGFAPAQYSYGSMLQRGMGVTRDFAAAASFYAKAAQQGNARAMHNYAILLTAVAARPGARGDIGKAVSWFEKAADLGVKDSQFNLGMIYSQGVGVPKDLAKAYKWFSIAAATGDKKASDKRDEVRSQMGPAELSAARGELAAWEPVPLVAEANTISIPDAWRGASSKGELTEAQVKEVQAILQRKGYLAETPDGVMGEKTVSAIRKFQRSAGLPVTGTVDDRLMRALRA